MNEGMNDWMDEGMTRQDCITYMTSLVKRSNDVTSVSLVVMTTENKLLHVINPENFNYLHTVGGALWSY